MSWRARSQALRYDYPRPMQCVLWEQYMSDHDQTRTTRSQTARKASIPENTPGQATISGVQPAYAAFQRAQIDPARLTAADVRALQGTAGNAAVQRLLAGSRTAHPQPAPFVPVATPRLHIPPAIQTALTVGTGS